MYKLVSTSSNPKEIGVRNGIYQVELIEGKSFVNKKEQKLYRQIFNGRVETFLIENFEGKNLEEISNLTFFPLKKMKLTDVISFSPFEMGLNFIVSEKVIEIFSKFNVGNYIKIKSKIEGIQDPYYTIGFPMVSNSKINYSKSVFYNILDELELRDLTFKEYEKISGALIKTISLKLIEGEYAEDIINLQGQGLFFSNGLITELQKQKVTGISIQNVILSR